MKKIKISVFLAIMFMGTVHLANAQDDPPTDPDPELPLDPGSWVLVAAGVGYGVKKWRDSKQIEVKKNSADNTFFLKDDMKHNNL